MIESMWMISKLNQIFQKELCRCAAILCSFLSVLVAQAPLSKSQFKLAGDDLMVDWKIEAANRALRSGLPGLAVHTYSTLLKDDNLDDTQISNIRIHLAAAYIAQQDFAEAEMVLNKVSEAFKDSKYWLYSGVLRYERDVDMLSEALNQVRLEELEAIDRPWFYLLRGLEAELFGDFEAASSYWEKAEASSMTEIQRAFFRSLILREQVMRTPLNEALADEIRQDLERLEGKDAYPYVKAYAITLSKIGQKDDAVALLNHRLSGHYEAIYKSSERDQLRLLRALILGVDTSDGRSELRELIQSGQNRQAMGVAWQLLAQSEIPVEELSEFLNEMISRTEPHPLIGQMYYIRSQLALSKGEIARAEADARYLLQQFPGLNEITNVYHLLAYAVVQRDPPQYRTAADFLIQLRDKGFSRTGKELINMLIGDCYFLNGDYSTAADFYRSALLDDGSSADASQLYLRLIMAELRAGDVDTAIQHIEQDLSIDVDARWKAEWNVAQALQARGEEGVALQRIQALIADDSGKQVAVALDLRIRWLGLYLTVMIMEESDGGLEGEADALLSRIESLPPGVLTEADFRLLIAESLFLKAHVLFRLGKADAGIEILKQLREAYVMSSVAERSYMAEASHYASIGDFRAAQDTLSQLAILYPDSFLVAKALFEAALHCERRGPAHYADAVRLHNELAERFPQDELVYVSRLKQGDLLRQMNDFAGAQIIYETLIHSQPEHPHRYMAELSQLECMLALARNNDDQFRSIISDLKRLMDIPNLPVDVQAEVAYKRGFVLMQMKAVVEAIEVFTLTVDRFLLDSTLVGQLGKAGRYWIARTMLDLGRALEEVGELSEAYRVYRKVAAYNLPGRNIAQARAGRLFVQ